MVHQERHSVFFVRDGILVGWFGENFDVRDLELERDVGGAFVGLDASLDDDARLLVEFLDSFEEFVVHVVLFEYSLDEAGAVANGGTAFRRQGICENCGALAESLWEQNGQLLCENCHSV